jgi:hypothetical protein
LGCSAIGWMDGLLLLWRRSDLVGNPDPGNSPHSRKSLILAGATELLLCAYILERVNLRGVCQELAYHGNGETFTFSTIVRNFQK